jgi:hypothetical protein
MSKNSFEFNLRDIFVTQTSLMYLYWPAHMAEHMLHHPKVKAGNTKGGSITVPLTSGFTGLD